jgi:hypothetical protein
MPLAAQLNADVRPTGQAAIERLVDFFYVFFVITCAKGLVGFLCRYINGGNYDRATKESNEESRYENWSSY